MKPYIIIINEPKWMSAAIDLMALCAYGFFLYIAIAFNSGWMGFAMTCLIVLTLFGKFSAIMSGSHVHADTIDEAIAALEAKKTESK